MGGNDFIPIESLLDRDNSGNGSANATNGSTILLSMVLNTFVFFCNIVDNSEKIEESTALTREDAERRGKTSPKISLARNGMSLADKSSFANTSNASIVNVPFNKNWEKWKH